MKHNIYFYIFADSSIYTYRAEVLTYLVILSHSLSSSLSPPLSPQAVEEMDRIKAQSTNAEVKRKYHISMSLKSKATSLT